MQESETAAWAGERRVAWESSCAEWHDSQQFTPNLGTARVATDALAPMQRMVKINIETRRSTTPGKRVILVQGPC